MRLAVEKRKIRIDQLNSQAYHDSKKHFSCGVEQKKLEEMVGWQINVNSNPDMQKLLYEQLKFPLRTKKRKGGEQTPTADYETLLRLGYKTKHEIILQCIKVRKIRKRCSDIVSMTPDEDGRIRSSINLVGAKTGRTTQSESPTGEGRSLQNITEQDSDLILADVDHDFCQCDLAGADGWTVAAQCARFGDTTMLDDYLFGLKPAKIVALMKLHGAEVNTFTRQKIKDLSSSINADTDKTNNYLYFTCKRAQHGTNYQMGAEKLSLQMFIDTDGVVDVPISITAKVQELYLLRYRGIKLWHQWCHHELTKKGFLINASGQKRIFFDRKDNPETLRDFIANEPQHNTTYITNLALRKLWLDPENRNSNGSLKIWPCHQVHDSLLTQWHQSLRDFAREKIPFFFNNPIMIAGIEIIIPYEGRFGPSWGEVSESNPV
jgi:DNA polymerase I-like protein with 3'-5' exonuclease and polymerase domains